MAEFVTSPKRATRLHATALLCATAFTLPIGSMPALAAAEPAADGPAKNDSDIIVTAQRRSERLEEVPMSVTVVSAQTLANAGVTNLRDLANVTSGYQLGAGGAFPQPAIRGVTTVINGTFENNVAVYVDGVYQPVAQALSIDLPNVESVQVLKGPQGTLYGRNATGGALLLTTAGPGNTLAGKAEMTYARFNDWRGSAYISGPLAEGVGFSLAGYIRRSDGYVELANRSTPGATQCCAVPIDQDAIRAKLRFQVMPSLTATLAYNFIRVSDSRTNVYSPIENVPNNPYGLATRPGGLTTLGVEAYDIGNVMQTKQHEGSLTVDWDAPVGKVKSITAYAQVTTDNRFDFDGSYIPSSYSTSLIRERTWQQAVDLTVNKIQDFDVIVGATYFNDRLKLPGTKQYTGNNPANPGTTAGTLADYTQLSYALASQRKSAWAAYADITYHLTPQLSINAGGRYSDESQFVAANAVALIPSLAAVLGRPNLTNHVKFKKFTPRASVRYELAPRTDVYFSYSQGFRSGSYNLSEPACTNTTPSCWQPAAQETIDAFELGFKTAGPNFHAEVSGFYYNYKNLQVSTTHTIAGFPVVDITNAPKASIYGMDASFDYKLMDNLTLRASMTWLHARYGDGFSFGGVGVTSAGGLGINSSSNPLQTYLNVSQVQDLSGLMMARAPNFSGNIGVEYNIPKGEGGLRFAANVKATSKYVITNPSVWGTDPTVPVAQQREQRFTQSGYALLNASVTWTDPTGHEYVRIWGTNLTDHRYRLHYSGTASNGTYSPMAEPLIVGGTVGYKF